MIVDGLSGEGIEHLHPLAEKLLRQGAQTLVVLRNQQHVAQALDIVRAAKGDLISLTPHRSSLEELFIREVRGLEPGLREGQ